MADKSQLVAHRSRNMSPKQRCGAQMSHNEAEAMQIIGQYRYDNATSQ